MGVKGDRVRDKPWSELEHVTEIGPAKAPRLDLLRCAGTVGGVTRYTPPSGHDKEPTHRRRSLSVRIGVWVLLVGVLALVFVDVLAALL